MNGLDVLTSIAQECFDIPVVMISGQGNERIAASAIKEGASDYIVKGPDYAKSLINAVLDATDRHILKTQLADSKEQLRVKDTAIQHRETELRELDVVKNTLLTNLAHTLKTPLVSIRGYNELILAEKLGPVTEEQQKGLEVSLRNVDKLLTFIEDYVAFTESDHIDHINMSPLNLNKILEDSVTTILPKAIQKKVKLSLDAIPSSYHITGDERRLTQALINIIDIAIHMTRPDGTIKVRVQSMENSRIGITIVSNSIATGSQNILAEKSMFNQNINYTREIIQFHHGDSEIEFSDERFAFSAFLTLTSESTLEIEETASPQDTSKLGTILIVDDDRDCLDLLSMILSQDFNIAAVKTGTGMFEILQKQHVDMILLDINMYDINGIDACRKLKQKSEYSTIPVYMISATLGDDKKQLSLEAGAAGFIEKPFEMETILQFIHRVFPKHKVESAN
jgi:DNA-binding response OmpR family regulator